MRVKKINKNNFRRFGRVIEYPKDKPSLKDRNLFKVILKEKEKLGWRIAYLLVREKSIKRLEAHLNTFESFEPVCGKSLIYLALNKGIPQIECFYLDKPVILNKGVWHGIVTLDGESEIKITENAKVKSAYWPLGFSL
jgi:ureidoglycolate hydrolase